MNDDSSPAEDESPIDSSASTPTSSSLSPSTSSDDDNGDTQPLRRHSRTPSTPPSPHSSLPPPNPDFPFSPDTSPPLSALPLILRHNLSFTSDYGPFRMSLASFFLGSLITFGLLLSLVQPFGLPPSFGVFVSTWGLFHWMEFCLTAIFHPGNLSFTSFLLNHSRAFHVAIVASLVEYFLEWRLFPSLKRSMVYPTVALPLLVISQSARSLSMWQASTNFTHLVSQYRHPSHRLITTGLYSLCRHPSYAAWYVWSISTQILLANPVCAVAYAYVGWKFFKARIQFEEMTLLQFFGPQYEDYRKKVPTGIPFLRTRAEER